MEENTEYPHNLKIGKNSFDKTQKSLTIKSKTEKMNFTKINMLIKRHNEENDQESHRLMEKLKTHISDKRLTTRMYENNF